MNHGAGYATLCRVFRPSLGSASGEGCKQARPQQLDSATAPTPLASHATPKLVHAIIIRCYFICNEIPKKVKKVPSFAKPDRDFITVRHVGNSVRNVLNSATFRKVCRGGAFIRRVAAGRGGERKGREKGERKKDAHRGSQCCG